MVTSGALFLPLQLLVHYEPLESDLTAVQALCPAPKSVETMLLVETARLYL
jgi:hypothetical protein